MAYQNNGPRAGRGQRFRNTLMNQASKTPPPPVGATSAVDYGAQSAMNQLTLAQRLAALRAEKGQIFGQFRMDRASANANAISGMATAVNSSLDRGLVGSSIDAEGRTGVLAQKASDVQAAIQAKVQGLLGLRTQRIDATNQYYNAEFEIASQRAAEQATLANQAFLSDLVMRMLDEQGPRNNKPNGTGTGAGQPTSGTITPGYGGAATALREGGSASPVYGANVLSADVMAALRAKFPFLFQDNISVGGGGRRQY